jgi:hypothetical protein
MPRISISSLAGLVLLMACAGEPAPSDTATVEPEAVASAQRRTVTVGARGAGPVRVGMTVAEARQATGEGSITADSINRECDYIRPSGLPEGISLMVVEGVVSRIDVSAPGITTAEGAGIGDLESQIDSLYGTSVIRRPHKYTDGSYLIVPAAGDTAYQLVFETDGSTVTTYRAGMMPMVQWVEGCS